METMEHYDKLNALLQNEYGDVVTYVELSKNGVGVESQVFRDIAREEYTHAKHIKNILQEAGKLEDSRALEHKAKVALESI